MSVGKRIKTLRQNSNTSQVELADAIHVTKQNLYKYENEIITNIPLDKIEAISNYFNVSPAYLMGWTDTYNEKTDVSDNLIGRLSNQEVRLVLAYREKSEMQDAVNKLLDIGNDEFLEYYRAARSNANTEPEVVTASSEKISRLKKAKKVTGLDEL